MWRRSDYAAISRSRDEEPRCTYLLIAGNQETCLFAIAVQIGRNSVVETACVDYYILYEEPELDIRYIKRRNLTKIGANVCEYVAVQMSSY